MEKEFDSMKLVENINNVDNEIILSNDNQIVEKNDDLNKFDDKTVDKNNNTSEDVANLNENETKFDEIESEKKSIKEQKNFEENWARRVSVEEKIATISLEDTTIKHLNNEAISNCSELNESLEIKEQKEEKTKKNKKEKLKKDPSFIPRKGYYFEHDNREDDSESNRKPTTKKQNIRENNNKTESINSNGNFKNEINNRKQKVLRKKPFSNSDKNKEDDRWLHDRFDFDDDQNPKSRREIAPINNRDLTNNIINEKNESNTQQTDNFIKKQQNSINGKRLEVKLNSNKYSENDNNNNSNYFKKSFDHSNQSRDHFNDNKRQNNDKERKNFIFSRQRNDQKSPSNEKLFESNQNPEVVFQSFKTNVDKSRNQFKSFSTHHSKESQFNNDQRHSEKKINVDFKTKSLNSNNNCNILNNFTNDNFKNRNNNDHFKTIDLVESESDSAKVHEENFKVHRKTFFYEKNNKNAFNQHKNSGKEFLNNNIEKNTENLNSLNENNFIQNQEMPKRYSSIRTQRLPTSQEPISQQVQNINTNINRQHNVPLIRNTPHHPGTINYNQQFNDQKYHHLQHKQYYINKHEHQQQISHVMPCVNDSGILPNNQFNIRSALTHHQQSIPIHHQLGIPLNNASQIVNGPQFYFIPQNDFANYSASSVIQAPPLYYSENNNYMTPNQAPIPSITYQNKAHNSTLIQNNPRHSKAIPIVDPQLVKTK